MSGSASASGPEAVMKAQTETEDEAEAEAMESAERTILAGIGVSDPYRFQNDR